VKNGILNRLISSSSDKSSSSLSASPLSSQRMYQWTHDALHKAAYTFLAEDACSRKKIYFRLGKSLYGLSKASKEDWMIYLAADQFNAGALICSVGAMLYHEELALLNLQAAKLSMARGGFFPAREMLRTASQRLDSTKLWTTDRVSTRTITGATTTTTSTSTITPPAFPNSYPYYQLSLDVYSLLAEMEFMTGDYDGARKTAAQVLDHSTSLEDKFRAQMVWIQELALLKF
jgi:tetratricopeptide (TPR) repeat protein